VLYSWAASEMARAFAFCRNRSFNGAFCRIDRRNFQNGRVLRLAVFHERPSVAAFRLWMSVDVERLDNAIPRDFSAKQINHRLRADMPRFAMVALLRLPPLVSQCARSPFNHFHEIANCPERVCDASGHRGRATNRYVGFYEIVIGVVKRDRRFEVFQFLGKSIRQSR
jgi:hypothetical protein